MGFDTTSAVEVAAGLHPESGPGRAEVPGFTMPVDPWEKRVQRLHELYPESQDFPGGHDWRDLYEAALQRQVKRPVPGVGTEYYGGVINWKNAGAETGWYSPLELDFGENKPGMSVDIVYIGCGPSAIPEHTSIEFSPASEIDLKLENREAPGVAKLLDAIETYKDTKQPRIFARIVGSGNPTALTIRTPDDSPRPGELELGLSKIEALLGVPVVAKPEDLAVVYGRQFSVIAEVGPLAIGMARKVEFEGRSYYITGVLDQRSHWKYVEVITAAPLEEMDRNGELFVRIDSGCVNGMHYKGEACDCLHELHQGMHEMPEDRGIIFHFPAHDSWGLGPAVGAPTENLKVGEPVETNEGEVLTPVEPMNAIDAIQMVLGGDQFEIRSYEGAAAVLVGLGFEGPLQVMTNNRLKVGALENAGYQVTRKAVEVDPDTAEKNRKAGNYD